MSNVQAAASTQAKANYATVNPEGYIEIVMVGNQTPQTIEAVSQQGAKLAQQMPDGTRTRQLVDISRSGKYSSESNKAAMKVIDTFAYQRVAIYGGNRLLKQAINMVIMLMGKGSKIKLFNTREQALAWLMRPLPQIGESL